MPDQTDEAPELGNDWDAAHRALIYARRNNMAEIERLQSQGEEVERMARSVEVRLIAARQDDEDIHIAIERSGYVPPKGFTKWGELA